MLDQAHCFCKSVQHRCLMAQFEPCGEQECMSGMLRYLRLYKVFVQLIDSAHLQVELLQSALACYFEGQHNVILRHTSEL